MVLLDPRGNGRDPDIHATNITAWACRLGPSMDAFTRDGRAWLASRRVAMAVLASFFLFIPFFYSCTILCVYLTETVLPNGSDYYLFSRPWTSSGR